MHDYRADRSSRESESSSAERAPGKRTLTQRLPPSGRAIAGSDTVATSRSIVLSSSESFVDSLLSGGGSARDGINLGEGGVVTDRGSQSSGSESESGEAKLKGEAEGDGGGDDGDGDGGADGDFTEDAGGEDAGDGDAQDDKDEKDDATSDVVTPAPPAVTFGTINYSTTPAGVGNRIPPRKGVKVPVTISGGDGKTSIEVSIDGAGGGNGDGKLDGKATVKLKKSKNITLKGTTQTGAGNAGALSLVAKVAAATVGRSNSFTICAIPTKVTVKFGGLVTGTSRGIKMTTYNNSDSGKVSDLDQVQMSEMVKYQGGTGCFAGITSGNNSGYLPANNTPHGVDSHAMATSSITGVGYLEAVQGFKFKDNRSGAADIGVARSGFMITRKSTGTTKVYITTSKYGAATTVAGISVNAGSGSAKRKQKV